MYSITTDVTVSERRSTTVKKYKSERHSTTDVKFTEPVQNNL